MKHTIHKWGSNILSIHEGLGPLNLFNIPNKKMKLKWPTFSDFSLKAPLIDIDVFKNVLIAIAVFKNIHIDSNIFLRMALSISISIFSRMVISIYSKCVDISIIYMAYRYIERPMMGMRLATTFACIFMGWLETGLLAA